MAFFFFFSMHSNETICKKNPAEQGMCAHSAFSIRNRPPSSQKEKEKRKEKKILFVRSTTSKTRSENICYERGSDAKNVICKWHRTVGGEGGCTCYNWVRDNCADYVGTAAFNGTFNCTLRLSQNKHSVPHELGVWLVYLITGFASWSSSCLNYPKRRICKNGYVSWTWDWNVRPVYVITYADELANY